MKRKIIALALAATMMLSLAACGDGNTQSGGSAESSAPVEQMEQQEPANLEGTWRQVNSNSDTSYQEATITGNEISIDWVDIETETRSVYWIGSFTPPTTADEPYTWESQQDEEKVGAAILASGDATKTFTYENDQIIYEASALGTTMTVRLERVE